MCDKELEFRGAKLEGGRCGGGAATALRTVIAQRRDDREKLSHQEIRVALRRVIEGSAVAKSHQLTQFLTFIVEETLAGRGDRLKAYTIATDGLGRDADFDPQLDPIVRVEAARLRKALAQHYDGDGLDDPVFIELPVGRYLPVFHRGRPVAADGEQNTWKEARQGLRDQDFDTLAGVLPRLIALSRTISGLGQSPSSPVAPENPEATAIEIVVMLDTLIANLTIGNDLHDAIEAILDAAIRLHGTRLGNVQVLDPESGDLMIIAQRGFETPFLEFFARVSANDNSACARALANGRPVVIDDVDQDEGYAPYRAIAAAAGYRAVQSTPLVSSAGEIVGMLSTHFQQPHVPTRLTMITTQLYAHLAADILARFTTSEARRALSDRGDRSRLRRAGP